MLAPVKIQNLFIFLNTRLSFWVAWGIPVSFASTPFILYGIGGSPASAALNGALVAFAAWAFTRELAPDYNGAAFVALVLAWIANVALGTTSVLPVFVALLLVRLVNRSTGPRWRALDTLGVLGFSLWAAVNMQQAEEQ